jgi:hypothetical protein
VSIDTSFKPTAATIPVSTAAVQLSQVGGPGAITTYRVRCLAATGTSAYFSWGATAAIATANLANVAALIAGTSSAPATIGMFGLTTEVFELPAGSFVIGNSANPAGFEFTPGQGA